MRRCSVTKNLRIEGGCIEDYRRLARYHYRDSHLGMFTSIFVLRASKAVGVRSGAETVGVIVYTLPSEGVELRNVATDNLFLGIDKKTRFTLINKNIRCIRRVIIEPRYRGLGLASQLVRETMEKADVPIVEAMAVMGLVNPFFEKAGMKAFTAKMPSRCVQLVEALSLVGIEKEELIDAERVQKRLDGLGKQESDFIEQQISRFMQSYGQRRFERAGLERTRLVLSKLTFRPVYYIWFNKKAGLKV